MSGESSRPTAVIGVSRGSADMTAATIDQSQLAIERTILAYERTLMAWIRTALSLITLGFTIFKFVLFLHQQDPERHAGNLREARLYGLCFIAVGLTTLALASWQHWQQLRRLKSQFNGAHYSLALVVAGLMACLGLAALVIAFVQT